MRPRIVLFVGNGFTIGFAHHLGVRHFHDTTQLIPPPSWIQDAAATASAKSLPLWHERRYPSLWEAWQHCSRLASRHTSQTQFHLLCDSLSKDTSFKLGPDPTAGPVITVNHMDAGYQLRRYLWHLLFLYNNRLIQELCPIYEGPMLSQETMARRMRESTDEWPLMRTLRSLAEGWELSIVSFNYDTYAEFFLHAHGHTPFNMGDRCFEVIDQKPRDAFRVIHPHGSMSVFRPGVSGNELTHFDDLFEEEALFVVTHMVTDYFPVRHRYPYPYPCPDYPDLVPPGHSEDHLLARWSDYPKTVSKLVSDADVVGAVGFSAAPPDDMEFKTYFTDVRDSTVGFSIGVRSDGAKLPSEKIIGEAVGDSKHAFFDALSEMPECDEWLQAQYKRLTKR